MNYFIIILILILIVFLSQESSYENFANAEPVDILIFVSKSCGHCVNYNSNMHQKVEEYAKKNGLNIQRIFSDNDMNNSFDKYNIEYVPACVIIKNGKKTQLKNSISPQEIQKEIDNM